MTLSRFKKIREERLKRQLEGREKYVRETFPDLVEEWQKRNSSLDELSPWDKVTDRENRTGRAVERRNRGGGGDEKLVSIGEGGGPLR